MTIRDRMLIAVVVLAAALGGFWFVGLAPKRSEAAKLQTQIDAATQQLTDAEQKAAQARQAKSRYQADYAEVASLGKAVPKSDALPSLLYQLQRASHGARVDFRSLKILAGTAQAATAGNAQSAAASASSANAAPAGSAAASTLPPGARVGAAGLPVMPFSFVFNGSFFDMEDFLRDVQRFVHVDGNDIDVRGRLLSIDGFSLTASPSGFPAVKAGISATAYLLGDTDATPATSPASTSAAASGAGAATTPPAAAVSGVTR